MDDRLKIAVVQMTSARTHAPNIDALRAAAREAAGAGCDMVALPEMAGMLNRHGDEIAPHLTPAADDPFLRAASVCAAEHGLWVHAGSTPVAAPGGRIANHSVLFDATGARVATYDKIHLFSAALAGKRPVDESDQVAPGNRAVLGRTPWGGAGMSVCYDLRFPQLYRAYGQAGARLLFVPSAFTQPTGEAHWEVLLRARAIENGCFVIAAAQTGRHEDGRRTHGHSMVIDPWGAVLCDIGRDGPGVAVVTLDLAGVERTRAQIPSLTHDRPFRAP